MEKHVLAQYTIRSKQEYIFRTNRIVEMMGGSKNISNAWNLLFEAAQNVGIKIERDSQKEFKFEEIQSAFLSQKLNMIELFCGGGNETILFDSVKTLLRVNQEFSYKIMQECPGMIPMVEYVFVTGDYKKDYEQLMDKSEKQKKRMVPGTNEFIVPFAMMDRDTFQPFVDVLNMDGEEKRVTAESKSKRKTGLEMRNKDNSIKLLDKMVTEKGKESLLAVVHADGNNMGRKIMEMLGDNTSYDFCISKMRKFTQDTDKVFVDAGLAAMEKKKEELKQKYPKLKDQSFAYRVVIADGDDMTFICNARFVMEYVKAYLGAVEEYSSEWHYSSCAGICIFHSHYPFARAYSLAEQCCDDSAKKMVHVESSQGVVEESWVDFHYIHSGVGGDLMGIRDYHGVANKMARPWGIQTSKKNRQYQKFEEMVAIIKREKIARTNIKTIGNAWEVSKEEGNKEFARTFAHKQPIVTELVDLFGDKGTLMKALYDLSEVYDLWFEEVK